MSEVEHNVCGEFRRGDRVTVGRHLTGVVLGLAKREAVDREPRLLVAIDGHDWTARPIVSIVTPLPLDS